MREHRPWPLPDRPWVMAQTWGDLLFAHWRVPPERLRPVVPPQLPIDVFDGSAWVGVTPFEVSAFHLRGLPPVPGIARFLEVNVRTYATIDGRPGIYFFSLDAASALAVHGARRAYRLPYFRARMRASRDGWTDYRHERVQRDGPPAALELRYRPAGAVTPPRPGTLEHFLAERYCLYTLDAGGRVLRGEIHHPPWPLQPAEADLARNAMGEQVGLQLEGDPLLHYAARQDVVFWRNAAV